MARHGYRAGAGRKPGNRNENVENNRENIERAGEQGLEPLDVILNNMRFYHRQAGEALRKLLTGDIKGTEGDNPNQSIIDGIKDVLELRKRASDEAARAAPYVHPCMGSAGEEGGKVDEWKNSIADQLNAALERVERKEASGKRVEFESSDGQ